jgi:hypothetical protein
MVNDTGLLMIGHKMIDKWDWKRLNAKGGIPSTLTIIPIVAFRCNYWYY